MARPVRKDRPAGGAEPRSSDSEENCKDLVETLIIVGIKHQKQLRTPDRRPITKIGVVRCVRYSAR